MVLYDHLYFVCLLGTIVSGAVSVFLFIKLDIRTAWRVVGKREKQKRVRPIKSSQKKKHAGMYRSGTEHKTVLLHAGHGDLQVIREILLVHTDEVI